MEVLGLVTIPDCLLWIFLLLVGLYILGTRNYGILSALGYSGPKPKPFLGTFTNQQFGEFDIENRKYGDVVALYDGPYPNLAIYDPEIIKHIMVKDFSSFCDRRPLLLRGDILSKTLLDLRGSEWKRMRNMLTPFFSSGKLKVHMEGINSCIRRLIPKLDKFAELADSRQELEGKKFFGDFAMEVIGQTAFGLVIDLGADEENPFATAMLKIMRAEFRLAMMVLAPVIPGLTTILKLSGFTIWAPGTVEVLEKFVKVAIEERKKSQIELPDFIQACLKAHTVQVETGDSTDHSEGKGMTDKEIMAHAITFLLAGYDTTSSTFTFFMYFMAVNQEWQDKIVDEIKTVVGDREITYDDLKALTTMEMCLNESMRIFPVIYRVDREAKNDVVIKDYVIPKGCLVTIPVWALHHDPEYWSDPDIYDPNRFSPEKKKEILNSYMYLPFGDGPRNCIGMRLAMMEMKLLISAILIKYRWTLSERTKVPLKIKGSLFPVVEGGLWFNVHRRDP